MAERSSSGEKPALALRRQLDAERLAILVRVERLGLVGTVLVVAVATPVLYAQARLFEIGLATGSIALAMVLAWAPIPYRLLAWVQNASLLGPGLALVFVNGPAPAGMLLCLAGLVFATLLLEWRESVIVNLATFGALVLFAWLHLSGRVHGRVDSAPTSPGAWLLALSCFVALALITWMVGSQMLGSLGRSLVRTTTLVGELQTQAAEREKALADLRAAQARLTQAQKLELLGQLAGGVAHDMNNALTAIIGEASMLADAQTDSRDRIVEAADYAAQLTRQLLLLGRRDVATLRSLDLVEEVRRALRYARRLVPSQISFQEQLAHKPVPVMADPMQLTQIVLNLVVNARDAMGGSGTLTVGVSTEGAGAAATARLTVSDTGSGIAPEVLSHVFEPFFTTKQAGEGTGLGLSNVQEIVHALKGTIAVESATGKGTTFHVSLPLHGAPAEAEAGRDAGATSALRGCVLLVEDDIRVRAVAYAVLARAGLTVLEAADGLAGIEVAQSTPGIDLVLTDVVMPRAGGAQVIEWFATHRPQTPVLVMSGYAPDERLRAGLSSGQLPFLPKPFTADQLVAAVAKLLPKRAAL